MCHTFLHILLLADIAATAVCLSDSEKSLPFKTMSYKPEKNFFLPYVLLLKENYNAEPYNSSSICERQFLQECQKKIYSLFYFNEIVYSIACENMTIDLRFCNYTTYNSIVDDATLTGHRSFFRKLYSLLERETRQELQKLVQGNLTTHHLEYKEVIMEDVPFCFSISCPSFVNRKKNISLTLSALKSMPLWCRCGFYMALIFDIALSFVIACSNGTVIIIGIRNSFVQFPWG